MFPYLLITPWLIAVHSSCSPSVPKSLFSVTLNFPTGVLVPQRSRSDLSTIHTRASCIHFTQTTGYSAQLSGGTGWYKHAGGRHRRLAAERMTRMQVELFSRMPGIMQALRLRRSTAAKDRADLYRPALRAAFVLRRHAAVSVQMLLTRRHNYECSLFRS